VSPPPVERKAVERKPDRGKRIFYRVAHAVVLTPFKLIFRVRIHGRGKVPRSGAFVVAPSHRSLMDIFFTAYITRRRIRFMAKRELFAKPFLAWLLTAGGGFPVDRGSADRAALRSAQQALAAGEPVAVFPEGTRNHGPDIGPLFDGAAYLAARLEVPVVPVAIGGSEEILASGKVIPRFRRVAIVVGEPLQPPRHEGRVRRQEVGQMTEQLRVELQKRFDDALALAGAGRG
jgi:1-acyl-sn-glycerol-3-phosphate acyltransferase